MKKDLEKKTFSESERMNSSRERVEVDERATNKKDESARQVLPPAPEPQPQKARRRMSLTTLFNVVAQKSKANEGKKTKVTNKDVTDCSNTWTSANGGGLRHSPHTVARRDEVRRTEEERMRMERTSNHSANNNTSSSENQDQDEALLVRFLQATFGQDADTARTTAQSFAAGSSLPSPPSNLKTSNDMNNTSNARMDDLWARRAEVGRAFSDAAHTSASSLRAPSNGEDLVGLKNGHTSRRLDVKRQDNEKTTSSAAAARPGAFHAEGRAFGAMPRWAYSQNRTGTTTRTTPRASRRTVSPLKAQERQRRTQRGATKSRSMETASIRRHPRNHHNNNEDNDDDGPEEPDDVEENGLLSPVDTALITGHTRNHQNNLEDNNNDGPGEPCADEENGLLGPVDTVPVLPTKRSEQVVVEATAIDDIVDAMSSYVHHTGMEDDLYVTPIPQGTTIASLVTPKVMDTTACCRSMVLLFFLGTLIISLVIGFQGSRLSTDTTVPDLPPTPSPTSSPTVNSDELQAILGAFSSVEDLEQVGSPQHKAMIWLANKDSFDIDFSNALFRQRYALVVLYYATQVDGNTWIDLENYLSPTENECAWGPSIKCNTGIFQSRLTGLDLGSHGLNGKIPTEIGLLTNLESLQLAENNLIGSVPNEISNLSKLSSLDLQSNDLSGSIPDVLDSLEMLNEFNVCGNRLTGIIPESIFTLSGLKTISVCDNQMSGTLSPKLENMEYLTKLNVRNNTMNGNIPASAIGDIVFAWLDHNDFSGSVPLTNGRFTRLEEFTCSNNQLSGEIPSNFTVWLDYEEIPFVRLKKLDISHNHLSGKLLDIVGFLSSLEHLDYSGNNLSGTIFPSVANSKTLRYLSLSNNSLTGTLPMFPSQIEHIELGGNDFMGGLSVDSVTSLQQLEYFSMKDTMVGGSIPTELGNLQRLKFLDFSNSSMTGSIPREFGELNKLEIMRLNANKIDGTLPHEIGALESCVEMNLDDNLISGMIPSTFGQLQSIKVMSARNNMLMGTIPVTLGNLDKLDELRLDGNNLEGGVPYGLCTLKIKVSVSSEVECNCCSSSSLDEHDLLLEDEP